MFYDIIIEYIYSNFSDGWKMKDHKLFFRILHITGYSVIGLLLILIGVTLISNAKGQLAFFGKYSVVWISTPSMDPTIPGRSYIVVEKITAADVQTGDVITFRSEDPEIEGRYNTHRVVEIIGDRESFVTKGDANPVADTVKVSAENVSGRFIRTLPVMSVFGRVLSSTMGIIISVTAVFALFSTIAIPTMMRMTNEKSKELETEKEAMIEEMVKKEIERLKAETENKEESETAKNE